MQPVGGTECGTVTPSIVASRGLDAGMADEALDGYHVGAGIEQFTDERPPEVLR